MLLNNHRNLILFFLISVFVSNIQCNTGDPVCLKENDCSCRYNDGTGINLQTLISPSSTIKYFQLILSNLQTVYYHPCGDVQINTFVNCSKASVCLESKSTPSNGTNSTYQQQTIGVAADVSFPVPDIYNEPLRILFKHGDFSTTIKLVCTPNSKDTNLAEKSISPDSKTLDLILYSPASCIVELPGSDGMSTGTFLITLLLMVSSIYFFGGAILLYALRGAQGRELIPHVDFWASLPELVRDGWIFAMNGFKAPATGANAYDQI